MGINKKCSWCGKVIRDYITIMDGSTILDGYEDCRGTDLYICIDCFIERLEELKCCKGAGFATFIVQQDVGWKFRKRSHEK